MSYHNIIRDGWVVGFRTVNHRIIEIVQFQWVDDPKKGAMYSDQPTVVEWGSSDSDRPTTEKSDGCVVESDRATVLKKTLL